MRRPTIKNKDIRKVFFLSGILLILIVLIIGFLKFNPLNVIDVDIKAEQVDCVSNEELKTASNLLGQNILLISEQSLEKKLKDKFLCVRKTKVEKNFPGRVTLNVLERQPVVILVEASLSAQQASSSAMFNFGNEVPKEPSVHFIGGGDQFLVDDEGVIFAREGIGAPKIYFEGLSLKIGEKIEEDMIKNVLKVLERINVFGVHIFESKISSQGIFIVNAAPKMLFFLNSNLDLQLAALQLLLEQAKIIEREVEFVDLRFEKPIVKYAPKKNN